MVARRASCATVGTSSAHTSSGCLQQVPCSPGKVVFVMVNPAASSSPSSASTLPMSASRSSGRSDSM
eukprot:3044405-Alexandrium_andersonii.AAC.1